MASKYRLAAKPGLARAGRFVSTKSKPVVIINKNPAVKSEKSKLKSQQPQKVVIRQHSRIEQKKNNVQRRRANKSGSRIRSQREKQQTKFQESIEKLKNSGTGRILIMVACGPSILETDIGRLKTHRFIDIMSINKPDPRLHPTKYWVFCDNSQYTRNKELFESYARIPINAWSVKARHPNQIMIRHVSGKGFSKNLLSGYYIGRSTTFANMQTAYWMNYDKTYIFGCDMSAGKDGKVHFYGVNPDVDPSTRVKRFEKEAEFYLSGAKQLTKQEREKFVFCTTYNKWPFIDYFECIDHISAIDHIIEEADKKLNIKMETK